jgi:hypothetical protein
MIRSGFLRLHRLFSLGCQVLDSLLPGKKKRRTWCEEIAFTHRNILEFRYRFFNFVLFWTAVITPQAIKKTNGKLNALNCPRMVGIRETPGSMRYMSLIFFIAQQAPKTPIKTPKLVSKPTRGIKANKNLAKSKSKGWLPLLDNRSKSPRAVNNRLCVTPSQLSL